MSSETVAGVLVFVVCESVDHKRQTAVKVTQESCGQNDGQISQFDLGVAIQSIWFSGEAATATGLFVWRRPPPHLNQISICNSIELDQSDAGRHDSGYLPVRHHGIRGFAHDPSPRDGHHSIPRAMDARCSRVL
jgi:hypothetical protein